MKAPKLVKTKKSQLKVPVTTAGRKMQFYRNSNRSGRGSLKFLFLEKREAVLFSLVSTDVMRTPIFKETCTLGQNYYQKGLSYK